MVRRGERQQHLVARMNRTPTDLRLADHLAGHRDRRVVAQDLLGRGVPQQVVVVDGDEALHLVAMLGEVPEP